MHQMSIPEELRGSKVYQTVTWPNSF